MEIDNDEYLRIEIGNLGTVVGNIAVIDYDDKEPPTQKEYQDVK